MDHVPRGGQVLSLKNGPHVVDDGERDRVIERLRDQCSCVFVAREDHGEFVVAAETRSRLGRGDEFGDLQDVLLSPAVRSSGHDHHVGSQLADAGDLLMRTPPIIRGNHIQHNRPRPQRGPLGTGR